MAACATRARQRRVGPREPKPRKPGVSAAVGAAGRGAVMSTFKAGRLRAAANTSLGGDENEPNLKLADNALDAATSCRSGFDKDRDVYFVEDEGRGLDGTPQEIASLYSIRRPMRSSKLLRLPQRGALGNGLRVVAGAVLARHGSLAVITRNQRIELRPEAAGSTTVVKVRAAKRSVGTRIEIGFGPALAQRCTCG